MNRVMPNRRRLTIVIPAETMKKTNVFSISMTMFLCSGCFDFGEDVATTSPTKAQLARCQAEMHLNPTIEMVPLGFKLEGSGIDDAIWFKFQAKTTDAQRVFDSKVVDVSKFAPDYSFAHETNGTKWWDVSGGAGLES